MSSRPEQRPQRRTSILGRAVRHSLLLACTIVAVLAITAFIVARSLFEQRVLSQLSLAASAGEDVLQDMMREARGQAVLLADRADVRTLLTDDALPEDVQRWQESFDGTWPDIVGVGVFDADGSQIAGVGGVNASTRADSRGSPVIDAAGWHWLDVSAPVMDDDGKRIGTLTLRVDATRFPPSLDNALSALGGSTEMYVGIPSGRALITVRRDHVAGDIARWGNVNVSEALAERMRDAVAGHEGVARLNDDDGERVLLAYHDVPSLGWAVAVRVRTQDALAGVRQLAWTMAAISLLLLALAVVLGILLARKLTQPLLLLTESVRRLQPGQWAFHPLVRTGDEVEILEGVIASMARRLQGMYENLEAEVRSRTEELKARYVFDRAILDGVDYGILTVDPHGVIRSANPAALRMLADGPAIIGGTVAEALPLCTGRDCIPMVDHYVSRCLRTGAMQRPGIQEHISIVRNGDPLPVNLLVSPLVQEGRLLGAVILFQDISEERRIDDMKSEFISLASHQLRTPISILNWYMELLGGDPKALNPEQAEYVREMRVAASRMSGLLNALLQVARLEGGIVEVNAHAVHVQAMMKEVLEDAAGMAKPKGITCTIDLPKASLELHTDGALLKVVLQNLATNAVKYGKKGGMLRITAADTPTAVRFTVADDGAGIPRSEQQKIFQKFFRARNVRQFDTDGNGLGLYMSKMIVDGLKGSLTFTSKEGKGTTFVVEIPKAAAADVAAKETERKAEKKGVQKKKSSRKD